MHERELHCIKNLNAFQSNALHSASTLSFILHYFLCAFVWLIFLTNYLTGVSPNFLSWGMSNQLGWLLWLRAVHQSSTKLASQTRPTFLLFSTNCSITHLKRASLQVNNIWMSRALQSLSEQKWTNLLSNECSIVVPLRAIGLVHVDRRVKL